MQNFQGAQGGGIAPLDGEFGVNVGQVTLDGLFRGIADDGNFAVAFALCGLEQHLRLAPGQVQALFERS